MTSVQVVLLLLGAGSAVVAQNYGYNRGYKYKYKVESKTLTAIPDLADQYAGIFNRAELYVFSRNTDELVGRLMNAQYAEFHDELPGGYKSVPGNLTWQPWDLPTEPFTIFLQNGAIHHMELDHSITNEQANQIKGIISQLQFNPKANKNIAYYKVMEQTVTGNCETLYDTSPFPEYLMQSDPYLVPMPELGDNYFEVIKTKNYSNCDGYQQENIFTKSGVSRVVLSGTWTNFTIQSACTTNKYMSEMEKAVVISQVNLTLSDYLKFVGDRPGPVNSINTTLVCSYNLGADWDANFLRYKSVRDAVKLAKEIAEEIQTPSQMPVKQTMSKFIMFTRILGVLDEKNFYEVAKEVPWQIFRDATAECGSLAAFGFIKTYTLNGYLRGTEAGEVISTMSRRIRPTKEFMKEFFEFVTNPVVQEQKYLNETALLAFSDVSGLDVNLEAISYFAMKLKQAEGDGRKFLFYIRTLGNIAQPKILDVFAPYFAGNVTRFQRLAIILALERMTERHPQLTRETLYQVYQNTGEHHEIRIAAVFQLMRTFPPAEMLQRMAEYTNYDPSKYVSAAVKSALESMSVKDENARTAYRMIDQRIDGNHYSVYTQKFAYFVSADHIFPSGVFGDGMNHYYMVSSIDRLFNVLKGQEPPPTDKKGLPSKYSTQKIAEMLNIKYDDAEELEGQVLFNSHWMSFDKQTIQLYPQKFRDFLQPYRDGREFNYTRFYTEKPVTFTFLMETGYPFVYTYKAPRVFHAGGYAQVNSNNITTNVSLLYSALWDAKVGFFTPMDHWYIAGYKKQFQMYLPLQLDLTLANNELTSEVYPQYAEYDSTMAHFSMVPYTAVHDISDIHPVVGRPINSQLKSTRFSFGRDWFGTSVLLEAKHTYRNIDFTLNKKFIWANLNAIVPMQKFTFRYAYNATNQDYQSNKNNEENPPSKDGRREYFARNAGAGIRNSDVTIHDFSLEFEKAYYAATFSHANSPVDEKQRFLAFFHAQPWTGQRRQMCFNSYSRFPNVPALNFMNALQYDATSQFDFQLNFGQQCQGGHQISMLSKFEQTDARKNYLEQSPMGQQCRRHMVDKHFVSPACQNVTKHASYFDRWSASVSYDVPTVVKNVTSKAYFLVAHYFGYPYLQENYYQVGNKDNKLYLGYQFEPDMYSVNFTLKAPDYEAQYNHYFKNDYVRRLFTFHPQESFAERISYVYTKDRYYEKCTVGQQDLSTFDNRTYQYTLGRCWHVILTNARPESFDQDNEFAVLMRDTDENQKEMMILIGRSEESDYVIQLQPQGKQYPRVFINGKEQEVSEKYAFELYTIDGTEPLIRGYYLPYGEIKFEIRQDQLQVYYDGYRARFDANYFYRDYVRGMCGTYNGDADDDFMSPKNCIYRWPRHFASSWALYDEESCMVNTKPYKEEAEKSSCYEKRFISSNALWLGNQEESLATTPPKTYPTLKNNEKQNKEAKDSHYFFKNYNFHGQTCETKYQYQYVEFLGKYCFSRRQLPVCEPHCRAEQKFEKFVDMVCLKNNDPEAETYKKQIYRGQQIDISGYQTTQTLKFFLPSQCVKMP